MDYFHVKTCDNSYLYKCVILLKVRKECVYFIDDKEGTIVLNDAISERTSKLVKTNVKNATCKRWELCVVSIKSYFEKTLVVYF